MNLNNSFFKFNYLRKTVFREIKSTAENSGWYSQRTKGSIFGGHYKIIRKKSSRIRKTKLYFLKLGYILR